jgi:hypothetical protein
LLQTIPMSSDTYLNPKPGRQIGIAAARSVMCTCSPSRSIQSQSCRGDRCPRKARNHRAQILEAYPGVQGGTTTYVQILICGSALLRCIYSFSGYYCSIHCYMRRGEHAAALRGWIVRYTQPTWVGGRGGKWAEHARVSCIRDRASSVSFSVFVLFGV